CESANVRIAAGGCREPPALPEMVRGRNGALSLASLRVASAGGDSRLVPSKSGSARRSRRLRLRLPHRSSWRRPRGEARAIALQGLARWRRGLRLRSAEPRERIALDD